jgi:hypothetical protein
MLQLPSTQEMKMEMENNLSPSPFGVKDQFVSRLGNGLLFSYGSGSQNHVEYYIFILLRQIINTSDMSFGNDKEMNR